MPALKNDFLVPQQGPQQSKLLGCGCTNTIMAAPSYKENKEKDRMFGARPLALCDCGPCRRMVMGCFSGAWLHEGDPLHHRSPE